LIKKILFIIFCLFTTYALAGTIPAPPPLKDQPVELQHYLKDIYNNFPDTDYFNVKDYGARGDGTSDDTVAIQNAIDDMSSGGVLYFPLGTYLISSTLYLTSSTTSATYYIVGRGKGTILKPSGASDFYIFKVNQDSDGNKIYAYPTHPRAVFMDFQVDGSAATGSHSLCWYNECSVIFKRLYLVGLLYGLYGTGYNDNVTLDYIYWSVPKSGGYLYRQATNGDSFLMNQVFALDTDVLYLGAASGGTVQNCNGGHYTFLYCNNITFANNHLEQNDNNYAVYYTGRWIFEKLGIRVTATDSTEDDLFSAKKYYLSGEINLIGDLGTPAITGDIAAPYYVANPDIAACGRSTSYPGSIPNTTKYYYTIAFYTERGHTSKATEKNATATADDDSMYLSFHTVAKAIVRIWRGTSTGTYDRYVDIPVIAGAVELFDTGTHLAGYVWDTTGVPSAPTSNTTNILAIDDATPSVAGGGVFTSANTGATTITMLDDGAKGESIKIIFGDADTTIDFTGTNLKGNAGGDWTPAADDCMSCTFDGTDWFCDISDNSA